MPYTRKTDPAGTFRPKVYLDGNQYEGAVHGLPPVDDYDKAVQLENEFRARVVAEADGEPARVAAVIAKFLKEVPQSPNTHRTYKSGTAQLAELVGDRLIHTVSKGELVAELRDDASKWRRTIWSSLLTYAVEEGHLAHNCLLGARIRRSAKAIQRRKKWLDKYGYDPLGEEDVERMIACCVPALGFDAGPRFAALIEFNRYETLRTGELCGLEDDDVDLDEGVVRVRRQISDAGRLDPKWGSSRTIKLHPRAHAAYVNAKHRRGIGSKRVFLSIDRCELIPQQLRYAWNKVRVKAGLPTTPPKALRAHGATRMKTYGASDLMVAHHLGEAPSGSDKISDVIAEHLGHTNTNTQNAHYIEMWEDKLIAQTAAFFERTLRGEDNG